MFAFISHQVAMKRDAYFRTGQGNLKAGADSHAVLENHKDNLPSASKPFPGDLLFTSLNSSWYPSADSWWLEAPAGGHGQNSGKRRWVNRQKQLAAQTFMTD